MPHKDKEAGRKYHEAYGKKHRDRITAKRHGLSLEDYQDLLIKQHGVCAICLKPEVTVHGSSKKVQPLSIDHDHITNKVRGLLCSKCNTAVGLLDNSCERAQALIAYLERFI
jgi:hypothetical protein